MNSPAADSRGKRTTVTFLEKFLATGFFSGYLPGAPGTAGSLVGLLLYGVPGIRDMVSDPFLPGAAFFIGVFVAGRVAAATGDSAPPRFKKAVPKHPDPGIVVIDEIVGMWVALYLLPPTLAAAGLAFLLFRILDIIKPFPVQQLEQIPGGWGIMLDDIAAGIYANVLCRILFAMFPQLVV